MVIPKINLNAAEAKRMGKNRMYETSLNIIIILR